MTKTVYEPEQIVAMAKRRALLDATILLLRELMWQLPSAKDHPLADGLIDKSYIKPIQEQLIAYRRWYDAELPAPEPTPFPPSESVFVERADETQRT